MTSGNALESGETSLKDTLGLDVRVFLLIGKSSVRNP